VEEGRLTMRIAREIVRVAEEGYGKTRYEDIDTIVASSEEWESLIAAKLKPMKEAIQFVLDDDEEWAGTMLTYKTDKALREILAMLSEEE